MATQPTEFQKQIIQDPQDIGNYFPTGLCMGPPSTSGSLIPGFNPLSSNLTVESALAYGYGNGLLLGPNCTYRIFPAPPFQAITAQYNWSSVSVGQKLPFVANTASPRSSQLLNKRSGEKVIQMDVPRTFMVNANFDNATPATATITLTGRGIDVWGRKLTSSCIVAASNNETVGGILAVNSFSAFFQLYEVEITALTIGDAGSNATFTVMTGYQFGLPYKLTDLGHVQSYSQWWEQILNAPYSLQAANGYRAYNTSWTEMTSNPCVPFYFVDSASGASSPGPSVYPFQLAFPSNLSAGFNGADQNVYPNPPTPPAVYPGIPSATTTDVRGVITPQAKLGWQYTAGPPVSYTMVLGDYYQYKGPFSITYYVPGADVFPWKYSQMMNQFQQAALLDGSVADGGWEGFGNSLYFNTNANTDNNCEPTLEMLIGPEPYSDF